MYKTTQTSIRILRPNNPNFNIEENYLLYPRASFEISSSCPDNYKRVIEECIECGWLKSIAHVRDSELFWEEFHK